MINIFHRHFHCKLITNGEQNTGIKIPSLFALLIKMINDLLIRIDIKREDVGPEVRLTVDVKTPWFGKYGLYNHFHAETKGRTVR